MRLARRDLWVVLLLWVVTLAVYLPVRHYDFIELDDPAYVSENRLVRRGLSAEGLMRACTTIHAANWHPLTTISHMADCSLFGLDPGAHHGVNMGLHLLASALLYLLLVEATGDRVPGAFVAGAFALHPLHVESVAWISERKDVLSAVFWMATLWAYGRYATRPSAGAYALVGGLFVLGLLSKPMLVTLPCVLLLWDLWPLGRLDPRHPLETLPRLLAEKLPLLALSALSSVVTLRVQAASGAVASIDHISFTARATNALTAYVAYLVDTVWPAGLAIVYPHRNTVSATAVVGALLILGVLSAFVAWQGRRHRCLITGWLWYLGTLVPVIGLVHVGSQARADRYTYIPLIGIFIGVAWGLDAGLRTHSRLRRHAVQALALLWLLGMAGVARSQLERWKDSRTLFEHALSVTTANPQVHSGLGTALGKSGDPAGAELQFRTVVAFRPDHADAHYQLGVSLLQQEKLDAAAESFRTALALAPGHVAALDNLALIYGQTGRWTESLELYRELVRLTPEDARARRNLAIVEFELGRVAEAVEDTRVALELARRSGRGRLVKRLSRQLASYSKALDTAATEP